MNGTSRSVVVRLDLETAQAIRNTQAFGAAMGKAMDDAEAKTARQSAALDKVGATAGKMGLVAAGALTAMGKAAMDWESQWAGVAKTVDGTAAQMADLENEIRGLARTMPATHQEIAATAEAAGQLGVARENIADFTKTMVMLGETTNLTSDDAATSIAQFMNVMESSADSVDRIGNTLVDLGNKGASTEAQILDMAQRLSGAGSLVGAAESDVLALASAMANLGIQSELGGGAIQRVFTNIYQSAAQGADGLSGFADVAGMSAQAFADEWENDPVRAFDAFLQGLGRIDAAGGNVVGALDDLGIKGTQNLQVMLRLAGAGDMLTTSLDQSTAAWEANTALTDEYGKRAETTGAQAQVAWNKIKDAGIEAGDVLLPVVAKVADGVGTLADAFGALPDPLQDSVAGILAITAAVGGGVWFTAKAINSITETKSALSDLGDTSPRTAGALKGVVAAAGGLAVLYTVGQGIKAIEDASRSAAPGVEQLTTELLALNDAEATRQLTGSLGDVKTAFDRINDPSMRAQLFDFAHNAGRQWSALASGAEFLAGHLGPLGDVLGNDGLAMSSAEAEASIKALDDAMAGIVASGGAEQARTVFEQFAEAQGLSKGETEDLLGLLPGYSEALAGAANDAKLAADGQDEVAGAANRMGGELAGAAPGVQAMTEAMAESREAAAKTADAFMGLGEGLNDSKVSLGDWIGQLEEQTTALVNFRKNAEEAGEKGVRQGLIDALREAGPEGALRMKQLADATDEEIERANKAWRRGQEEVNRYIDDVGGVPPADLEVKTEDAEDALGRIMDQLQDYGLTTEQATAALRDVASGKIKDVQGLINKYGLTKAEARALLKDLASGSIAEVRRRLSDLDGDTATTYIKIVRWYQTKGSPGTTGTGGAGSMDLGLGGLAPRKKATGGPIVGPGSKTSDSVPVLASNGEFMMSAAAVDYYGLDAMFAMNARRLAAGGPVSGWVGDMEWVPVAGGRGGRGGNSGRPLDNRIEILRLQQSIADLTKSLAADGKNKISGLERRIAQAELLQARRELRDAREAPAREAREARIERRRNIRDAYRGFEVDADMSPEQIRDEIADFRRDLREAGGTWTKELQGQTSWLIASADALERETARRETLNDTLEDQQRALEQLQATMAAYSESVSGNFRTNPFNRSISLGRTAETAGAPLVDPALLARQDQLAAAEAQLAALRANDDGSVANAAEASRLLRVIRSNQAEIDALTKSTTDVGEAAEETVTGLEALKRTLLEDTERAEQMDAALRLLAEKGLDTTGPLGGLYRELAASGDVDTATELSKLAPEVIAEYEQLWAKRDRASAEVAALATQAVYGEQQAVLVEQVAATTAAIEASTTAITQLQAAVNTLGADVRAGAKAGAAETVASVDRVKVAVDALPGKLQALLRKDRP